MNMEYKHSVMPSSYCNMLGIMDNLSGNQVAQKEIEVLKASLPDNNMYLREVQILKVSNEI